MTKRLSIFLAASAASLAIPAAAAPVPAFDLLIRGGEIYSGEARAPFRGSIGVKGDRIVYVGKDRKGLSARRVIDAGGMAVLPGLINVTPIRTAISAPPRPGSGLNAPWLMQGVTTIFIGVDGYGTPDVGKDSKALERSGIGTNIVPYVGFGAVRQRVLGASAAQPDAAQLDRMRKLVAGAMCDGAIGFSTGLFYARKLRLDRGSDRACPRGGEARRRL